MDKKLYQIVLRRRTIRLFKQKKIPLPVIKKAIETARVAPSAANLQFLEYLIVNDSLLCERVFSCTKWGGYVYPKRVPPPGRRPPLYIVVLINKLRASRYNLRDVGAAVQNILLLLSVAAIGSCWIISLKRRALSKILGVPAHYKIDSVVAAGYPAERPKLETDAYKVKYWLDSRNRLHVPKRPLADIWHLNNVRTSP